MHDFKLEPFVVENEPLENGKCASLDHLRRGILSGSVVGDALQRGLERMFTERSQADQRLQEVADAALGAALVLDPASD